MGTYASSLVFANRGSPPHDRMELAWNIVHLLQAHRFLREGATGSLKAGDLKYTVFDSDQLTHEEKQAAACLTIQPELLTSRIRWLTFALPSQSNPNVFELPHIHIVVLNRVVEIHDGTTGKVVAKTWAGVEFSFEDVRLSLRVHMFRGWLTRFFRRDLPKALGSPVSCSIVSY